jgi:crossover junction endodeoxyribonuclease RusA
MSDDRQSRPESTIVIPMLPDRALSPNARCHWREKARAVEELRVTARLATLAGVPYLGLALDRGAVMDVEIAWCCRRKVMDDDNAWASLKAARDGVADVLFGGEDRFIVQGAMTQCRGAGTTTITLREVGDG